MEKTEAMCEVIGKSLECKVIIVTPAEIKFSKTTNAALENLSRELIHL
ncbi:MAG: hypothetical protein ACPGN3_17225 [Opitutales bacterium]